METYATTTAPTDGPAGPRAGNGRRIGAYLVDSIVAGIPLSVLLQALPAVPAVVLGVAAWIAYFALLESRPSGQTLGKRLFGIRVIVFTDGGPLDLPRAGLRAVIRFITSVGLGVGYLAGFFDREKQAWHDVAAQTVVVPTSAYPVPGRG
jgi:uncharacterized RDD family membrane protein YckC